jgi:hypothetical protein
MNIRFHSSVLITKQLDKLKEFYISILKQEIEHDFGACIILKCGLSLWNSSDSHPVTKISNREGASNQRMELCFETEQFDEIYINLKQQNLKLLHDLIEEPWGQKVIRFFDPDENIIEVGESISGFVCRLYNEGLSVQEIVAKTSVSEENVKKELLQCK